MYGRVMDHTAPPTLLMGLPPGKAGTWRTLEVMRNCALHGKINNLIRQQAVTVARTVPGRDYPALCAALQAFVKTHITYVPDVRGVETVQTPDYTLRNGVGDCDDQSVLLASLLEAVGQPARFRAVGFRPGQLSHVYVQCRPGSKGPWLGAETIIDRPFGWNPPGVVDELVLEI